MQHFNHKERRFLIPPKFISVVEQELRDVLPVGRTYEVFTRYLDTPERTWSALTMGETHPKIRFRVYDGRDSFLEKKMHTGGETTKERIPAASEPDGLISVGEARYSRTEYVLDGTRVTIDRSIRGAVAITEDSPTLDCLLIEVKGVLLKPLSFLKPFERKSFSKFKWLTGRWKSETS